MKLRLRLYYLKQAIVSISNNRMVHVIGMGTMVISLLIFGTFLFLFYNMNMWIYGWGHTLSMSVYLEDEIDASTRESIVATIQGFSGAEIKRSISKADALEELRRALGSDAGLITSLSKNPLPASYEVVFKEIESPETDPKKIKATIEGLSGVAEVQYSAEWLRQIGSIMDVVRLMGIMIGGLLGIGVLSIMTNTIKLTIYSRKNEIEIQKLVGATDWFVKAPFLLEGFIQGVLSGGLALILLYLGHLLFAGKPIHLLGLAVLHFTFLPASYVLAILTISILLGLAGSLIAVGRFIAADSFIDI